MIAQLSFFYHPNKVGKSDERSRQIFQGEWFFTGDKYYVDEDGYYWHAGRADDMLKVGGIWVSPMEVESMLISHPAAATPT